MPVEHLSFSSSLTSEGLGDELSEFPAFFTRREVNPERLHARHGLAQPSRTSWRCILVSFVIKRKMTSPVAGRCGDVTARREGRPSPARR